MGRRSAAEGPRAGSAHLPVASATRPATGATSWSTRASRTPKIGAASSTSISSASRSIARNGPDLDQIYMTAVQLLTQHGGWPMSVFLTPDLKPFLRRHLFSAGRPLRPAVFQAGCCIGLADAWQNRRDDVADSAEQLTAGHSAGHAARAASRATLDDGSAPQRRSTQLRRRFDPRHGGFGRRRSFRIRWTCACCCGVGKRFGDDDAPGHGHQDARPHGHGRHLRSPRRRLPSLQHRRRWLVPHFEKMLYDNALLTVAYLEASRRPASRFTARSSRRRSITSCAR